jgi:hypothetical protein
MCDWFRLVSIGTAVSATLIGCTMQNANVPPAQLMSELQAGQPMLNCSMQECGLGWMNSLPNEAALEATGQWQDLALSVMRIGYEDDLSYYYLGRAAENLGYLQAAQKYYRIAEQLSVTDLACATRPGGNICNGYVFPDALYPHLEVVESQLAAMSGSPPPPPAPHRKRLARKPSRPSPTGTSASGSSQAAGSGFVVPTPTAAPAGGSGFVEPAPAMSSSDQFATSPVRH